MRETYIQDLSYSLGPQKVHIEESHEKGRLFSELEQLKSAGFEFHHMCPEGMSAYELAHQSVQQLLEQRGQLQDIDAIIYATCLPINANIGDLEEYKKTRDIKHLITYPASKLQADFDLPQAFVVGIDQQACTSMLGAIRLADIFIKTDPNLNNILCLTADRFPSDAKYEQSYNLISDGAASTIVSSQTDGFKILACSQITNGAMAQASDDETVGQYFTYSHRLILQCLEKSGLSMQDIRYVIPQNTNSAAWQILGSLLNFDLSKVLMETLSEVGHCISGDNIINLKHANERGAFEKGDKILMLMAGFGLNWQCVVIEKV